MPGGLHPPPSVIASWPKPNYVDPVTQGNALTLICIVMSAIGIVIVTARIYSRLFITKAPGIDDALIIVALAFALAFSVLVVISDKVYKTSRHVWDIPISLASGSRLNVWCAEWCYVTASCSVKISILLFYRRLSASFSKPFLVATWTGIVYNVLCLVAFALDLLLECRPTSAYWLAFDPTWLAAGHTYSCPNPGESLTLPLSGALSVVGDFYSTMLPLGLVYFLDLPRRQKAALYVLFAMGFLVVIAGCFRTVLLNRLINETYDFSWTLWKELIWTTVELYVAIFAASAPSLKPFFRKFFIEPITTMNSGGSRVGRHNHRRRNERREDGSAGKDALGMWSQTDDHTTVRDSGVIQNPDLEKNQIGVALTHNEMEMEEFSPDRRDTKETVGLALPIQPTTARGLDRESDLDRHPSQGHTVSRHGSSDWILPPVRISDTDPIRKYRAEIEALPALPPPQQGKGVAKRQSVQQKQQMKRDTDGNRSSALSGAAGRRASAQHVLPRSLDGSAGVLALGPPAVGVAGRERYTSQGSIQPQQVHVRQIQIARAQEMTPQQSSSAGSRLDLDSGSDEEDADASVYDDEEVVERDLTHAQSSKRNSRNVSRDRRTWRTNEFLEPSDDEQEDGDAVGVGGGSSSQETLGLPRQGSRDDFHSGHHAGGKVRGRMVGVAY